MAEIADSDQNISTEHQKAGDAQLPQDGLDRDQEPEGGLQPEAVEDRPNVGTVKPEDGRLTLSARSLPRWGFAIGSAAAQGRLDMADRHPLYL